MKRALILSLFLTFIVALWADGGVFPPSGEYFREPSQQAVISYHGQEEVLHLLIRVDVGSEEEFGWIVPLPSAPTVEEDTIALFDEIQEMCRPSYGGFGCGNIYYLGSDGGYRYEVDILDEGSVGSLEYKTIQATDPDTLFGWLTENDYWVPDSARAIEVFSDYIDRNWVFVMFKVEDVSEEEINVQPVKFTFSSSQIVYPLKITSLNFSDEYDYYYVYLLLHVVTDHRVKVEEPDAYVDCEYANMLSASEYEAVEEHYPEVAKVCNEGDFITRLYVDLYSPDDFSKDYVLVPEEDDTESPTGGFADAVLFPLLPMAFVVGIGARRKLRKRRKE